jgi:hypothetical protein
MAETFYKFFNAKVLEWENLTEAANKHQSVYKYVPFPRKEYLCSKYEMTQNTVADQYTADT